MKATLAAAVLWAGSACGQSILVDFESVPGIPRPHGAFPGLYTPLGAQIPGLIFGQADLGVPAGPALLTYSDSEFARERGAFGPALSGDTALYAFPGRLVFPFPTAPQVSSSMVGGIGIRFQTPVLNLSSGVLASDNSTAPYANMIFTYTLLDGTQNFVLISDATPGSWALFAFQAPQGNPLVSATFRPVLSDRTASNRPFAIDDLTYTPIPSPAGAILVGLGGLAALRRRR